MAGKKKVSTETTSKTSKKAVISKAKAQDNNGLSLSTETFKALVSKASKGVGNNKLIPLTQLMCIQVKDGVLTIITSDFSNTHYLYVKQDGVAGDFYVTVMADQFAKLIGKLTCDKINLQVGDGKLKIIGNGEYTLALQYDEMGNPIQYPDPLADLGEPVGDTQTTTSLVVKKILTSIKSSLAQTMEYPYLTGYYVGDKVCATDGEEMGIYNTPILESATLMFPIVFDLLSFSDSESISIDRYEDGVVVFEASDMIIYSHEMEGIDEYPIQALNDYFETNMPSSCVLPKNELLQALDRLSLFVGDLDDNAIKLQFDKKALRIESLASTGVENITYTSNDGDFFECQVDLTSFTMQVKSQSTDTVTVQYADENALKLVDGDIVKLVSLFSTDEE